MNFDESIKRLKEICSKLSSDGTTLEETAKLYKEGLALSEECLKTIEKIKSEINSEEDDKDAGIEA